MSKPRRTLPATELRVHLGEALRALETEDLVIEKGGVPVALLIKYRSETEAAGAPAGEYERALSHRAEPAGWQRMDAVMASGWAGVEPEEFAANVYRWREAGAQPRHRSFEEPELEDDADERPVSGRQRRLYPRRAQGKRVADGDAPGYTP